MHAPRSPQIISRISETFAWVSHTNIHQILSMQLFRLFWYEIWQVALISWGSALALWIEPIRTLRSPTKSRSPASPHTWGAITLPSRLLSPDLIGRFLRPSPRSHQQTHLPRHWKFTSIECTIDWMFYQDGLMDLGDKILGGGHSCDMCRVARDLRACDEPRMSRVSIREIEGPSTSQPTTVYIICIRLINH